MANGTALFNAIYAQNWVAVVNLVAGVNDPDRGNNQGGLYGRRELGAMMEEFIYMRGWIASVPETLLTQRRTVERTLVQTEAHLYGSSRLGVDKVNRLLLTQTVTEVFVPFSKRWVFLRVEGAPTVQPDDDSLYLCIRGKKRYEFSNHLGNVMTTLTDRRVWSTNPDRWVADAVSGQDYDPFGMVRPNRSASEDGYRFGFNGKEFDKEWNSGEMTYDFGARIYDERVARWLSVDPLAGRMPHMSPYASMNNSPVAMKDPDGKIPILVPFIVGGLIGFGVDVAVQVTLKMSSGSSLIDAVKDANYNSALITGLETGGIAVNPSAIVPILVIGETVRSSMDYEQGGLKTPDLVEVGTNVGINLMTGPVTTKAKNQIIDVMETAVEKDLQTLKKASSSPEGRLNSEGRLNFTQGQALKAEAKVMEKSVKDLQRNFNTGVKAALDENVASYATWTGKGIVDEESKSTNRFPKPNMSLKEKTAERDNTSHTFK